MANTAGRKKGGVAQPKKEPARPRAVPLGGRRGHSGYEYHDAQIAGWYAQALHEETTGVISVQTESRGPVDDAYIRFANGPDRYEQYKERLGDQRELKEILTDFRDRHGRDPDAILAIVTRDAWEDLRDLVWYAKSDDDSLAAFREMMDTNANLYVRQLLNTVCTDLFGGDEARALAFLRHIDVKDSGPDRERIARDTTAAYLQRVVQPPAGAFDLLVRLAQTTGKQGTPLGGKQVRAYLEQRGKRVFSLQSVDRLFLTPSAFRRRVERDVPFGYAGPMLGRDALLHDLVERLAQGAPVLAISGAPGLGKTRLCLDLPPRLSADARTRGLRVLFVRPDALADAASLEQLKPGERYVIVLDNADEAEAILLLLREALGNPDLASSVQVVVTIHPSYAEEITRALGTANRTVAEIPLEALADQDMETLLGEASYDVADMRVRDQVVRLAEGNPLLAQFAVQLARAGGDLSGLHARDVPSRYLERFIVRIGWNDMDALHRYIAVLAALGRVEMSQVALRDQIHVVTGLDTEQEGRLLYVLQRAGVLRRNVRSMRLKPDLLRHHVLDVSFFVPGHRYSFPDLVVAPFLPFKPNEIMLAAAEAERRASSAAATEVLDEVLAAIAQLVWEAGSAQRLRLVALLRDVAVYRPDDALEILLPMIEGPEVADEQIQDPLWGLRTLTHAHVLEAVVERLGDTRYYRLDDSLDALFTLATYRPEEPRYGRVRADALAMLAATSAFDPFTKPYDVQASIIEHLEEWITRPGGVGIAVHLLPQLLATGFRSTRTSATRPRVATLISGMLSVTPDLVSIYQRTIALAEQLYASSADVAERTAILKAFNQLIQPLHFTPPTPELRQALAGVCDAVVAMFERRATQPRAPRPALEQMYVWAQRARQLGVLPESRLAPLLELPQTNSLFAVYLRLVGFPARYGDRRPIAELDREQETWLAQTALEITPETLDAWLDTLRRIVVEQSQVRGDFSNRQRIKALLEATAERDPALRESMIDALANDGDLRALLQAPFIVLRRADPETFRSRAEEWLSGGRLDLLYHVAHALAWSIRTGMVLAEDHVFVSTLVGVRAPDIDLAIIPCLPTLAEQQGAAAITVAKEIASRGEPVALVALASVLPTPQTRQYAGRIVIRDVPDGDYLTIVSAFEALDQLDSHIVWCLEHVADIAPEAVVAFFEHRIQREATASPAYSPLPSAPDSLDLATRLRGSGRQGDLLRRARDLSLQGDLRSRVRARELFHLLGPAPGLVSGSAAVEGDHTTELVLREWIQPRERERLLAVAGLLRDYAVSDTQLQLVRDILVAAAGDEGVEAEVEGALVTISVQWGPISDPLRARADLVQHWERDPSRHVRRFAKKVRRILLGHAEESDAATEDLLEEHS